MAANYEYKAFISYKRDDDKGVAQQIQHMLETFTPPKTLRPKEFKKWKICLDKTDFKVGVDLPVEIRDKISKSEFLIALYSDKYTQSDFCTSEIDSFKETHNNSFDGIVPCIVSGNAQKIIPQQLKEILASDFSDATPPVPRKKLVSETLKIACRFLNCEYDDLYNRVKRRKKRHAMFIWFFATLFIILLTFLSVRIFLLNSDLQVENTDNIIEVALKKYNSGDISAAITMLLNEVSSINDLNQIPDKALYLLSDEIGAFNATNIKHRFTLSHETQISYVTLTCNGRTILSEDASAIYLWSNTTGELIHRYYKSSPNVQLSFGNSPPTEAFYFYIIENNDMTTIDSLTGEILAESILTDNYASTLTHVDSDSLYSQYKDTYIVTEPPSVDVFVYTLSVPNEDFEPFPFKNTPISNFTFSPSGEHALFTNSDTVYLYNVLTKDIDNFMVFDGLNYATFVGDNKICLQSDYKTAIYNLAEKEEVLSYIGNAASKPSVFGENVFFLSDARTLIYSADGGFSEWVPKKENNLLVPPDEVSITNFNISPSGKVVAEIICSSESSELRFEIFDPQTKTSQKLGLFLPMGSIARDFIWVSNDKLFILFKNGISYSFLGFDTTTGRPLPGRNDTIPYIQQLIYADDANSFIAFSSDSKLYKISVSGYSVIDELELNATFNTVYYEYLPDENILVLKLDDTAYFINTKTFKLRYKIDGWIATNTKQDTVAVSSSDGFGFFPLYTPQELISKANRYMQQN